MVLPRFFLAGPGCWAFFIVRSVLCVQPVSVQWPIVSTLRLTLTSIYNCFEFETLLFFPRTIINENKGVYRMITYVHSLFPDNYWYIDKSMRYQ
jgi:hypothetical protein